MLLTNLIKSEGESSFCRTSARLLAPGSTLKEKQLIYGLGVQTVTSGEWPGPEDGDT